MQFIKKKQFYGVLIFSFFMLFLLTNAKNSKSCNTHISLIHLHILIITHITCNQNTQNHPKFAEPFEQYQIRS
jgi:hypothetical protein